jgi:hypothetical protein
MGSPVLSGTLAAAVAATIVPANDAPAGWLGRQMLYILNTGLTNPMNVAIGADATTADIYLAPGGDALVLSRESGALAPAAAVSAISTNGTTMCAYTG